MSARRYIAVVQAEGGYPPPGAYNPAPPEGPKPPAVHSVVLANEYDDLHEAMTTIYARLATSSTLRKTMSECVEIAKKALGLSDASEREGRPT